MDKTSKKHFPESFLKEIWSAFNKEIKKAASHKEIIKTFDLILTPDEKVRVEKRLAIAALLKRKIPIKEISRIVDVNRGTIWFVRDGFKRKIYRELPKTFLLSDNKKRNKKGSGMFRRYRYIRN